jgi:hypothetical protein
MKNAPGFRAEITRLCGDQKVNTSRSKKNTSKKSISGVFLQADGQNRTDNLLITRDIFTA